MSRPQRIQRKRTKGWRMPAGAVYVGRPTKWGNPWRVEPFMGGWSVDGPDASHVGVLETEPAARAISVDLYRELLRGMEVGPAAARARARAELRGRDLACWCPLDQPCHADVLLELANT